MTNKSAENVCDSCSVAALILTIQKLELSNEALNKRMKSLETKVDGFQSVLNRFEESKSHNLEAMMNLMTTMTNNFTLLFSQTQQQNGMVLNAVTNLTNNVLQTNNAGIPPSVVLQAAPMAPAPQQASSTVPTQAVLPTPIQEPVPAKASSAGAARVTSSAVVAKSSSGASKVAQQVQVDSDCEKLREEYLLDYQPVVPVRSKTKFRSKEKSFSDWENAERVFEAILNVNVKNMSEHNAPAHVVEPKAKTKEVPKTPRIKFTPKSAASPVRKPIAPSIGATPYSSFSNTGSLSPFGSQSNNSNPRIFGAFGQ
uniref:Uncharacterized protein n=1 Tax=Panagrolaimus sp. JU765 TaxID=591449 RepID=A0AC34R8G0_9BILA